MDVTRYDGWDGMDGWMMQLSFETGKVGRQASGAVMARDGETVVYSTACTDRVCVCKGPACDGCTSM